MGSCNQNIRGVETSLAKLEDVSQCWVTDISQIWWKKRHCHVNNVPIFQVQLIKTKEKNVHAIQNSTVIPNNVMIAWLSLDGVN